MADQNNTFPMISEKTWWTIREKFQATVPSVVSTTYVKSLLSLGSDNSAISNVISPLKRMGLIDNENKPTPLAFDWRLNDKYKTACDAIINNVYPTELLDLFPNKEVDRNQALNWFMGHGVGQKAAGKMLALFSLLKSGEIKDKKATATTPKTDKPKQSKTKVAQTVQATDEVINHNQSINSNSEKYFKRPNLHIDLQIHISPDSTPEQIECIFASMAKHLYGVDGK